MRILKKILSTCLAAIVITGEIVSPGLTVISSAGIENTGAKDGVTETLSRERVSEKTDSAQKTIDFNDYNFTYTKDLNMMIMIRKFLLRRGRTIRKKKPLL